MNTRIENGNLLPAGLLGVLVLVMIWSDGGFDLRYWAPLAILSLSALIAIFVAGGNLGLADRPVAVAVAAIWGLAIWALASSIWADSPGRAWESGSRDVLYAATLTLAVTMGFRSDQRRLLCGGLLAGVSIIMVATLIQLFADGAEAFAAGRVEFPAGYRNAAAATFAFAVWPAIGLAAVRGYNAGLRAGGFSIAVLGLGLAFLTQSRGIMLGLAAGGLVAILIGPDRLRRGWLLIAAAGLLAIGSGALLEPYHAFDGGAGTVSDADVDSALRALLLMTALAFVISALVFVYDNGLRSRSTGARRVQQAAAAGMVAVVAIGLVGGLAKIGNPFSYADDKVDEFTNVESEGVTDGTRLGSVGGQRYDLWRISLNEFAGSPIGGVGQDNFQFDYYEDRKTDRNLSDPHGLFFQVLAETGIVGFGLLLTLFGGLGFAVARRVREAERDERIWIAGAAAAGTTILAQSLVDWLWLFPGVVMLALLALGFAAAPRASEPDSAPEPEPESESESPWARRGAAAVLALLLLATTSLYLSDLFIRDARVKAGVSAAEQLSDAETAESLNPLSITPLYLQASAHETMDQLPEARAALEEALEQEPRNFVTLSLLGDFEVRQGDNAAARAFYARALALNPLDTGLQQLSVIGLQQP